MTHHLLEGAVAAHQLLGKSHTLGVNEVRGPFGIHGRCAHLRRRAHYNYQGTDGHSHRHCARNLQKSPLHGFTLRRNGTEGLHRSNYLSVSVVDGQRIKMLVENAHCSFTLASNTKLLAALAKPFLPESGTACKELVI